MRPRAVLHCSSIVSISSLGASLLRDWLSPLSISLQGQSARLASGEAGASGATGLLEGLLEGLDVPPHRWALWALGPGVEVEGPPLHPGGATCTLGEVGRLSPDPPITTLVGVEGGIGGFQSGGGIGVVGACPDWDFFPVHCGRGVLAGTGGGQDTGATSGDRAGLEHLTWRVAGPSLVGDVGGVWKISGWPPRTETEKK